METQMVLQLVVYMKSAPPNTKGLNLPFTLTIRVTDNDKHKHLFYNSVWNGVIVIHLRCILDINTPER